MRITVRKARKSIKRNKTISLNRKPNGQCIYCSFDQFHTYLLNNCVIFSTLFHLFHKFPSAPKIISIVKRKKKYSTNERDFNLFVVRLKQKYTRLPQANKFYLFEYKNTSTIGWSFTAKLNR